MIVPVEFFDTDEWRRITDETIVVSGGFDPLHGGHVRYVCDAASRCPTLVAVVNGNGFLERKKGRFLLDEAERAFVVDNIKGVRYTVIWDDGTQFVAEILKRIRPTFFAKGGDRSSDSAMPPEELAAVKEIGCSIVYGVGSNIKENSSSDIMRRMQ